MSEKGYDQSCYDLAKSFLEDEETNWWSEGNVKDLAQEIQDLIEDYIANNRPSETEDDEDESE